MTVGPTTVGGGHWQPVEAGPFSVTPIFWRQKTVVTPSKEPPGAAAPGPRRAHSTRVPRQGGNVECPLLLCSLPHIGGNVEDFLCYRFLLVDATERRPCVRGAAPVRRLGLRGCNRSTESDEIAGEGRRHPGLSSSASPTKLEGTGYNPSDTSVRTGTTSPHPQGVCDIPKRQGR